MPTESNAARAPVESPLAHSEPAQHALAQTPNAPARENESSRAPPARAVEGRIQADGGSIRDVQGQPQSFGAAANRLVLPTAGRLERDDRSPAASSERFKNTRKRLGPRPLWNVLHTLRGTGADSVKSKDEMNQLALNAVFALGAALLIIIVLVWVL